MKSKYHAEITRKALSEYFSQDALKTIIIANICQDRIRNQLGRDYIHFDSNAFESGFGYINDQHKIIVSSIDSKEYIPARKSFGRICHSWQDFYSHSNYVKLWLNIAGQSSPSDIDFNDDRIMKHPKLHSGMNYGLTDFLAILPGLGKIMKPLMPEDSHAKMNLDSPKSGSEFYYAYFAALKRTKDCFRKLILELRTNDINEEKIAGFKGQ